VHGVTTDYLAVTHAALLRGRWITDDDTVGALPVVVLSDEAVRRYFGVRTAGRDDPRERRSRTVVGIDAGAHGRP
jgi:hypothetical protein